MDDRERRYPISQVNLIVALALAALALTVNVASWVGGGRLNRGQVAGVVGLILFLIGSLANSRWLYYGLVAASAVLTAASIWLLR
jgi:hypothetical protein